MLAFRFSLRWLMAAVAFASISCAALTHASKTGAAVLLTATIGLLVAAPLGIAYRTGSRRAFWVGFSLFGWVYFTFVFGPWFDRHLGTRLATTQGLNAVWQRMAQAPARFIEPGAKVEKSWAIDGLWFYTVVRQDGTKYQVSNPGPPSSEQMRTSGQALFAILVGVIGGLISKWFCLTRDAHAAVRLPSDCRRD